MPPARRKPKQVPGQAAQVPSGNVAGSELSSSELEMTEDEMVVLASSAAASAVVTETPMEESVVMGPPGPTKKLKRMRMGVDSASSATDGTVKADKRVSPVSSSAVKAKGVPPMGIAKCGWVDAIKGVTRKVTDAVFQTNEVTKEAAKSLLEIAAEYEALLMSLVAENASLKGKSSAGLARVGQPAVGGGAVHQGHTPAPVVKVMAPPPKPVETWSLVVRSKNSAVSSKEIVSKVVGEVGPTLGVRVHEVKPIRGGGAVIRTPSKAEREKVAKNAKFKELELDVSVTDRLEPKVVVQGVHMEITPDQFMVGLWEMNLKEQMGFEEFKKGIRMISRPWTKTVDGTTNVVLEGGGAAMDALLATGRCYIMWFSFRVRPYHPMPACFRCLSFDHRKAECKMTEDVCRRCGQQGHRANGCTLAPRCRNCAFKGNPADHLMMSAACPVYSGIVARANARH